MYNPRNFCFKLQFSASVSFDFETRIMSTCMSTSRPNYFDMSIWKRHADHSTSPNGWASNILSGGCRRSWYPPTRTPYMIPRDITLTRDRKVVPNWRFSNSHSVQYTSSILEPSNITFTYLPSSNVNASILEINKKKTLLSKIPQKCHVSQTSSQSTW